MKRVSLLFMFLVILFHCSETDKTGLKGNAREEAEPGNQTDCEKYGLKGRVRQWIRQSFGITNDPGDSGKKLLQKEVYIFNQSGMQIEVKGYNEYNEIISESYYTYNQAGAIEEETFYDGKGVLLVKRHHYYDGKGNKIKETYDNKTGNFLYTSVWKYNDAGKVVDYAQYIRENSENRLLSKGETTYDRNGAISKEERTEFKHDGGIQFRKLIYYNEQGKITESLEYNEENILVDKSEYDYNNRGDLVRFVDSFYNFETEEFNRHITTHEYDKAGKLLQSNEPGQTLCYVYDNNGNETGFVRYNESGNPELKTITFFDDNNNKSEEIKLTCTPGGEVINKYVYTYDKGGNLILWEKYDNRGNFLYKHRTLYDDKGNKIEEVKDSTEVLPKIKYMYSFDEKGNLIHTACYRLYENEEPLLAMVYEYILTYWE